MGERGRDEFGRAAGFGLPERGRDQLSCGDREQFRFGSDESDLHCGLADGITGCAVGDFVNPVIGGTEWRNGERRNGDVQHPRAIDRDASGRTVGRKAADSALAGDASRLKARNNYTMGRTSVWGGASFASQRL